MKKIAFVAALAAASLAFSGLVMAQGGGRDNRGGHDNRGGSDQQERMQGGPGQNQMQSQRPVVRPLQRNPGYRGKAHMQQRSRQDERGDGPGFDGRGAGPDHNFRRGGRLPPQYRNHQYVVDDWRGHHLNAPPRGYHWVQTGGDYVLVGMVSGIIAQILLAQ